MFPLAAISEQTTRLPELAGLPQGWWRLLGLALLAALAYWVFWLYRREARAGAGRRLRMTLAGLRCLVLLLLAAVWPEPRMQSIQALLGDHDAAWLRRLSARNELALYAFGERTTPRPLPWQGAP